ncbi:Membrane-bound transcription factor site-1 protease [Balamuthia mandrillaris]
MEREVKGRIKSRRRKKGGLLLVGWRTVLNPSTLFFFLSLLLLGCFDTSSTVAKTPSSSPSTSSSSSSFAFHATTVEDEFIVQFRSYGYQKDLEPLLRAILPSSLGWTLVPRHNPASTFPTDFALIKVSGKNATREVLGPLQRSNQVKRVIPQRKFINALKEFEVGHTHDDNHHHINLHQDNDVKTADSTNRVHPVTPNKSSKYGQHVPFDGLMRGRQSGDFSSEDEEGWSQNFSTSRRLHSSLMQVTHRLNADYLWDKTYTGTGVRVAIFDTGLRKDHPHFRNIRERTNWTDENSLEDGLGHGTFVAGVIASQSECLGFAPDVDLYIFRVFTNDRVSYTSWFLDAFNYAIHTKINVLNLSIGGPDFMDMPFIEKVWEMSANNIIVVSAIGNDGPLYGTLNNPADQLDVIGVGGITFQDTIAPFSSRGMTAWELPSGYGRVKPDIVAYGESVSGSRIYGGCRSLSGTSVASPVVAGAVALLASTVPERQRWSILNPASMKQVLVETAERLPDANIFEQGMGKLNLLNAHKALRTYTPRASVVPSSLDLTDCPYMWPYCSQPIYYGGMPTIVNATILNGMGVVGEITETPQWLQGVNGEKIELAFEHSEQLWPWTGYLAIHIRASPTARNWEGEAEGIIRFTVSSPPAVGETQKRSTTVELPLKVKIVPTPPREKRILFDQYHNLRYPSGYFPRDALWMKTEPFDWNGDHIHTNLKDMYTMLRRYGYFVEVLGSPFTCFNASEYGTLLLVDPEEEFFPEEVTKLYQDVTELGLSVLVFADWYNADVMQTIKFFDENTRQWWTPATGGSNVPALNDLLKPFGIAFGDRIYDGEFQLGDDQRHAALFASGTAIASFPKGGTLLSLPLHDQTVDILTNQEHTEIVQVPVLGMLTTQGQNLTRGGRIAVFGDSSCLDNIHQRRGDTIPQQCLWLLERLLQYSSRGFLDTNVLLGAEQLRHTFVSTVVQPPMRLPSSDLPKFSKVLNNNKGAGLTGPRYATLPQCSNKQWLTFSKSRDIVHIEWMDENNVNTATGRGPLSYSPETLPFEQTENLERSNVGDYFAGYLVLCVVVLAAMVVGYHRSQTPRLARRINSSSV